jgi:hypothetical protein
MATEEEFDEQAEMDKLWPFIDAVNTGYQLAKMANDKDSPDRDKALAQAMIKLIEQSKGDSDRITGLKAGKKNYEADKELEKLRGQSRNRDRGR